MRDVVANDDSHRVTHPRVSEVDGTQTHAEIMLPVSNEPPAAHTIGFVAACSYGDIVKKTSRFYRACWLVTKRCFNEVKIPRQRTAHVKQVSCDGKLAVRRGKDTDGAHICIRAMWSNLGALPIRITRTATQVQPRRPLSI